MKWKLVKFKLQKKIKLVQVSVGLKIHYTPTPTHTGTKHKLKINKLNLTNFLCMFYKFFFNKTLTDDKQELN